MKYPFIEVLNSILNKTIIKVLKLNLIHPLTLFSIPSDHKQQPNTPYMGISNSIETKPTMAKVNNIQFHMT